MLTDYHRYRLYEILPGFSIWLTLILSVVLSFVRPLWMIYFIILFDVYWVLRVSNFSFYLLIAWRRFRLVRNIDWPAKMLAEAPGWADKRQVVFLTVYDEEWRVVRTALESVAAAVYDKDKFTVVIAGEGRQREHFSDILNRAQQEFGSRFAAMRGTLHPADLPDEIPGKGSNLYYAEREIKKYIDERGWNYDEVIVTVFDIDTVCHPAYFAYLTYLYCRHPRPTRTSYQPIALYNNNMWESPAILRIMAFGTTFWMLTSLARQDSLVTFSSHSMSFRALVDAGFHDKRIVSEDSRIFYQCLLAYDGDYEVTPMYIPVSMDTVRDDSWWQSVVNLYRQQRRWAWGAEHIAYLLWEFRKKGKKFPWWKKIKWLFVEWEGKWSWCVIAFLITFLGRLPLYVAPESVRQSAFFFNAPHILETLMNIAMMGLFLSATLSFPLLPKRPASHPSHRYITMVLQWLLLPMSLMLVSALPALDAVTHLMFGKYLGFNVSQKKRT
ncbi:MAG: glycosyltransferase family 2 protein [Candidatus Magasanikbacteria bacterium]|nr:glycosyltransferase family 2 protein [Candidatus Magasanikbacteria bacterium]